MKLQNPRDIKIPTSFLKTITDEILDPYRTRVQTGGGMVFVGESNEPCGERDILELIACVDMGITEVKTYVLCQ